jgi:magnesium transporter
MTSADDDIDTFEDTQAIDADLIGTLSSDGGDAGDAGSSADADDIGGVSPIDIPPSCDEVKDEDAPDPKFAEVMPLVDAWKWIDLRMIISEWPPPEVADFMRHVDPVHRTHVMRFLPRHFAADVFSELIPAIQAELLTDLTNTEIRNLLSDLDPDDRTALMDEMSVEITRKLLNLLSPQDLKLTRELLGYPEGSVGRMMTPNVVHIKEGWTVRKALDHIRKFGHDSETINVVYITDATGKLIDDITLSHLILASPDEDISALMDNSFIAIQVTETQEEAVEMIKKYNYFALPVVDSDNVLLGIVTVDDLMDIADTHATKDFHKLGAVSVEGVDGPIEDIREASVWRLYRSRIVWLVLLVFVSIFSGAGIAFFEDTIAAHTALVFFLTLLIGSGGNTGSQSATLMVRALATGDVRMKDWGKMLFKEMMVAGALGSVMAAAAAVLGIFRDGMTLAFVVGLSMFVIVITGSLIGMSLPFILRRLKKDPAMASAPLVASVVDIVGILIYFSIASVIL